MLLIIDKSKETRLGLFEVMLMTFNDNLVNFDGS